MSSYQQSYGAQPALTQGVKHLLIINGLVFLASMTPMLDYVLSAYFALFPPAWGIGSISLNPGKFYPWQIITYMFLHGGPSHIIFNMFGLYMFGQQIEANWGTRRFVTYYFLCGIGAAVLHMLVAPNPVIGASGGVFGILLAYAMIYPNRHILLLIPPIPIKAKYLVAGYGALELFFGVTSTMSGVAHFAHLGGMIAGFLLIRYWRVPTNLY